MSDRLFRKIVEEIGRVAPDTEIWPTFYGEALILGDKLWAMIDYAAEVGCRNIVLNSNAKLLDRKDHLDRILRSPLKRFILSLDGHTRKTFESIRVGGNRDRIYASVEKLLKMRLERQQKLPVIICQFSAMEENEAEIEAFKNHWKSRAAEVKVRTKLEWTATGSIRSDRIDHTTDFRIACPWGNSTMAIHQNGDVVCCAVDYEGMFKVGNVEEMSVTELWRILGEKSRKPHREHRWNDLPDVCKGCGDWQAAGAEYEKEKVEGTRPFWYYGQTMSNI